MENLSDMVAITNGLTKDLRDTRGTVINIIHDTSPVKTLFEIIRLRWGLPLERPESLHDPRNMIIQLKRDETRTLIM